MSRLDEIKETTALWRRYAGHQEGLPSSGADDVLDNCDWLVAEVERLRRVIKNVESTAFESGCWVCIWCGLPNKTHHSDCEAFTPNGDVK